MSRKSIRAKIVAELVAELLEDVHDIWKCKGSDQIWSRRVEGRWEDVPFVKAVDYFYEVARRTDAGDANPDVIGWMFSASGLWTTMKLIQVVWMRMFVDGSDSDE